ncbi:MAG: type II secretion system protein [Pseudomonadota bacterium]|nr:type II secretion system protein [Pseudomonadota bacterium]
MQKKSAGFTLPEMILVVVVLGIFLTMVFPDITRLIQFNAAKIQEANMKDIQLAVEARAKDADAIRADGAVLTDVSNTLINYLSPYTRLPRNRIAEDEWGQPLLLEHAVAFDTYRGVSITVNYFAALSTGVNKARDTAQGTAFPGAGGFGANLTAANYANLAAAGDDYLIKFTDYPQKIAVIDDAVKKLEAIERRLEAYAEARFAEYITVKENWCTTAPRTTTYSNDLLACYAGEFAAGNQQDENKIVFYPADQVDSNNSRRNVYGRSAGPGSDRTNTAYATNLTFTDGVDVAANSIAEFNPHTANTENFISNSHNAANRNNRGAAMVRLMRIIGLPDDYCCTSDGEPFYYYSLPANSGSDCVRANRPWLGDIKKPPIVSIEARC